MNGKKTLPLLVIASMLLSLVPSVMFANAAFTFGNFYAVTNGVEAGAPMAPVTGVKGDIVAAKGTGATAGTTISIYWDDATISPYNGVKGLLNSTTVKSSGAFDVWFTVPEATNGLHYLWLKDSSNNVYGPFPVAGLTVNALVKRSASSGLPGDGVTVSDYGFSGSKDVRVAFGPAYGGWTATAVPAVPGESISATGTATEYTGSLAHANIMLGSVAFLPAPTTVTVNYVTGAYDIVYTVAPAGAITVSYSWFDPAATVGLSFTNAGVTNSVGTAATSETVPANDANSVAMAPGSYFYTVIDANGNQASATFKIGPVITVTPTASSSGTILHLLGRGFTGGTTITNVGTNHLLVSGITLEETTAGLTPVNCYIYNPIAGTIPITSGTWAADVVLPQGNKVKDDYTIYAASDVPGQWASASFEVTALSSVSLTPQFGAPGTTVTVSGTNFAKIADTTVAVDLVQTDGTTLVVALGTVKTLGDGSFSKSFTVPAQAFAAYKIRAQIATMGIKATSSFTIGNLVLLLGKTSAPVGASLSITGTGFTSGGSYNITLGSKTLVSLAGPIAASGVISSNVYIPTMAPGVYTLTVFDKATGIAVTAQFTVSFATSITLSPSSCATGKNVTITGQGFKATGGNVNPTYIIYNKTTTGTIYSIWTMNVKRIQAAVTLPSFVNATGYIDAWWDFNAGAVVLSKGTYYVNCTDPTGYKSQAVLTIVDKVQTAVPRKASFAQGETVSFNIQYSYNTLLTSYLKVYDPSGNVVFNGNALATWVASGDVYVVPYSAQTAGGNLMQLADDAPTGTWTYKWISGSTTLASGSFTVTQSPTGTTDAQIQALAAQITAVSNTVTQLSSTISNVATSATAASNAATAASTAAGAAATAAQAATTAANAAGTKADAATAAANAAKTSADNAAAAASGLTTLVYAAIGASLVAALAAIVALMQISRKIA